MAKLEDLVDSTEDLEKFRGLTQRELLLILATKVEGLSKGFFNHLAHHAKLLIAFVTTASAIILSLVIFLLTILTRG